MVCGKGPSIGKEVKSGVSKVTDAYQGAYKDAGRFLEKTGKVAVDITTGGALSQRDALKAQEQQIAIQQRRSDINNVRNIRSQIREARIARANVRASASSRGVSGGSGEAGLISSVQSQLGTNVNYIQQQRDLQQQELSASKDQVQAQFRASLANTIKDTAALFSGGA